MTWVAKPSITKLVGIRYFLKNYNLCSGYQKTLSDVPWSICFYSHLKIWENIVESYTHIIRSFHCGRIYSFSENRTIIYIRRWLIYMCVCLFLAWHLPLRANKIAVVGTFYFVYIVLLFIYDWWVNLAKTSYDFGRSLYTLLFTMPIYRAL